MYIHTTCKTHIYTPHRHTYTLHTDIHTTQAQICMHTHICTPLRHIHMHTCTHIHTHTTKAHTCVHRYTPHTPAQMHTQECTQTCMHTNTRHVCTKAYTDTCTRRNSGTHTCMHIDNMHTQAHRPTPTRRHLSPTTRAAGTLAPGQHRGQRQRFLVCEVGAIHSQRCRRNQKTTGRWPTGSVTAHSKALAASTSSEESQEDRGCSPAPDSLALEDAPARAREAVLCVRQSQQE